MSRLKPRPTKTIYEIAYCGSDSVCFSPRLHEKQIPRYARDDSALLEIDLKLSHYRYSQRLDGVQRGATGLAFTLAIPAEVTPLHAGDRPRRSRDWFPG